MILLTISGFFHHLFENPSELFEPEKLIRYGGLVVLFLIVFAQTGLFFCFFFPGDALIFAAGVFYASGSFRHDLQIILLTLISAAILGNIVGYWVGRKAGKLLEKKNDSWFFKQEYLHTAKQFYDRYKGWAITGGMFLPIIRTFAPVIAGIIRMPFKKFFGYVLVGATAWIGSLVTLGYLLGRIEWVRRNIHFISLFLVVVITAPVLIRIIAESRKRRRARKKDQSADTF